jgi:hypothetical protein
MTQTSEPIEYIEIPGAPGKYFVCPRMPGNATLSATACASQFTVARYARQDEERDTRHYCRNCPTGAMHAGIDDFVPRTKFQESTECVRCGNTGRRLIGASVCISCKNREYEVLKGRNAKGTKPIHCAVVYPMQALVRDGKRRAKLQQFIATGMLEVILAAAKRSKDRAIVGFRGRVRPSAIQLSLF